MSASADSKPSPVGDVRRLAQYRPFERGGLDLRAVLHDLVLAIGAIERGSIGTALECRKAFLDCWGLEVEVDELKPILEALAKEGLAHKQGSRFQLSTELVAEMEGRAADWEKTEDRAFREWELKVAQLRPGVTEGDMNSLRSDLRDWLHLIITRHGADAAMMLYPEDERSRKFFDAVAEHGFSALPERPRHLADLREQALPLFIREPSPDQRLFLASLLNVSFYMTVLTIDPMAKKLVMEQMDGHRLYLDTNFLYAVLGAAPPEEVYSTRRLLQMSRDLGCEIAVTPWTMNELRTSIARSRRNIESQMEMVRPELGEALLQSSGDKGFDRFFWQAYNKNKTKPKDVFDRLEHFEHELEKFGIKEVKEGCVAVEQQGERIKLYSSLLNSERWPMEKDWIVLEHDAKCRLLVERLRGEGNLRFSNARMWFLTYDSILPRFAKRVPDNGDEVREPPFCVSPSAWVQIIRALTPRTEDFDRTVIDLLTSPFLGYRRAVDPTVVQEVIGRMDHYEDASPELAIEVLADTAQVGEIEKALKLGIEEKVEEAVRSAYSSKARELQVAVAESAKKAAKADREREEALERAERADTHRKRERGEKEDVERQFQEEREAWNSERKDLAGQAQEAFRLAGQTSAELGEHKEQEARRRKQNRRIGAGIGAVLLGILIAVVVPLTIVEGKWAIMGVVVGGIAISLIGVRVLAGAKWGGEIVLWATLFVAIAAIAVAVALGSH
jgi:uncharacterized membrane protein